MYEETGNKSIALALIGERVPMIFALKWGIYSDCYKKTCTVQFAAFKVSDLPSHSSELCHELARFLSKSELQVNWKR
jgi:hypothetical protein